MKYINVGDSEPTALRSKRSAGLPMHGFFKTTRAVRSIMLH